jgi:hypothetical protein
VTGNEALREENDTLKCQMEAYKNEIDMVKSEGRTLVDMRDKQIQALQQALQNSQQVGDCVPCVVREYLGGSGQQPVASLLCCLITVTLVYLPNINSGSLMTVEHVGSTPRTDTEHTEQLAEYVNAIIMFAIYLFLLSMAIFLLWLNKFSCACCSN